MTYINFGVGTEFSFERDLSNYNRKIRISSFDDTVSTFYYFKWCFRGVIKYFLKKIKFSELFFRLRSTYYFITFYKLNSLNNFVNQKIVPSNVDDILDNLSKNSGVKIDIEGYEYEILENLKVFIEKYDFLIIEFHDISRHNNEILEFIKFFEGYMTIAHLHINNSTTHLIDFPKVIELTLVRKDETVRDKIKLLPNLSVDFPNNLVNKDFILDFRE
jgi:hypothetical protein